MLYTQELSYWDKLFEYAIMCWMKYMYMHAQTRRVSLRQSFKYIQVSIVLDRK